MSEMFAQLAAEFPRDAIHWRAQKLTKSGEKALALAYLDARDVQDRLDDVCTPGGWRNTVVETAKGRLLSTIEIKIDGEWIGKCDGAGDTAVEGEKGGISDAFKRSAVLWGVGRYLYRMPNVWAPCESDENNGKRYWKAWKGSPWDHVKGFSGPVNTAQPDASLQLSLDGIAKCETKQALKEWWDRNNGAIPDHHIQAVEAAYLARGKAVNAMDRVAA